MQARIMKLKTTASGELRVYNSLDQEAAVVHQYDRFPELQANLFSKHVYWVDTKDKMAEWNQDEDCKIYAYVEGKDPFKGTCCCHLWNILNNNFWNREV